MYHPDSIIARKLAFWADPNLIKEYQKLKVDKNSEGIKTLLVPINLKNLLSAYGVQDDSNPFGGN